MAATRKSKASMKVSGIALETSVELRFLPSRAMEATLNNMWCCPITDDCELVAEIQSQVEARWDARLRSCGAPSLFPSFVNELPKYADVTQEEIDDAWLDAAIDLLGRPALKPTSENDYTKDLHEHARRHRMSCIWPHDHEAAQQSFTGRPAIRHAWTKHNGMLDTNMEDPFEMIQHAGQRMSNTWSDEWEAVKQAFPGRPARRNTPTSDYHMLYVSLEDPFKPTQRDGWLMSSAWPDDQEEDLFHTGKGNLSETTSGIDQRMTNMCSDVHGALQETLTGQDA